MLRNTQAVESGCARVGVGRVKMREYAVSLAAYIALRSAKKTYGAAEAALPVCFVSKKTTLARFELTLPKEQDF